MSLAAGPPNHGGGGDVHDVKGLGRCPTLRNRQPQRASGGQMRESASDRQDQARSVGQLDQFCSVRVRPSLAHAMCRTGQVTVPQAPLSEAQRVRLRNRERSAAQLWRQRSSARHGPRLPEGSSRRSVLSTAARHTSREVAKIDQNGLPLRRFVRLHAAGCVVGGDSTAGRWPRCRWMGDGAPGRIRTCASASGGRRSIP